jgi:hypothetical protein
MEARLARLGPLCANVSLMREMGHASLRYTRFLKVHARRRLAYPLGCRGDWIDCQQTTSSLYSLSVNAWYIYPLSVKISMRGCEEEASMLCICALSVNALFYVYWLSVKMSLYIFIICQDQYACLWGGGFNAVYICIICRVKHVPIALTSTMVCVWECESTMYVWEGVRAQCICVCDYDLVYEWDYFGHHTLCVWVTVLLLIKGTLTIHTDILT